MDIESLKSHDLHSEASAPALVRKSFRCAAHPVLEEGVLEEDLVLH